MDFTNKTVLITGASRGIGAESARAFAAKGANVALLARGKDAIEELRVLRLAQLPSHCRAMWPATRMSPLACKRPWIPLAVWMC